MKRLLIVFCLLCFVLPVFGLTMQIPKYGFFKGEELVVSGSCDNSVNIFGKFEERTVLSKTISCLNGSYAFRESISMLVPAGEITVFASEGGTVLNEKILVKPTRESSFLNISILSPVERNIARTEAVNISVSILDASTPVENAVVKTWSPILEPVLFENRGSGVFVAPIEIPFDQELEEWRVLILAETQSSGELIGGEQSISISIIEAPIILDLDSPKESTLLALEKTVFRIKASYANGAFLQGGAAVLFLDGKEISMKKKENGFFEASYTFSAEETDLQHVSVQVSDAIGNHGTLEQDFFVVADIRVQFFALLPILVVLVILAVLVTWLVIPRIRVRKTTESTQKRKMELEQELVSLQKQYFEQNAISKQTLSKKSFELNKELTELNKKLNTSTK